MSTDLVNIIFGMKVRQARTAAGLTLTELARRSGLSPSYLTEIEKGRKYPRNDKILNLAAALGKEYDELVSIKLRPSLRHLESTLSSSIFRRFPFAEFGLETGDLVTLLTREPEKASALLHAVLEIGRQYDLQEEDFLRAALRSYREIHENYFPDLENAALDFTEEFGGKYEFNIEGPISRASLEALLQEEYGYVLDYERIGRRPPLTAYRSVFLSGKQPRLLLNDQLYPRQIKFLLARELGYHYLELDDRSTESTPDEIHSFQQLLDDFRAAYFGGALLMPQAAMLADLEQFFGQPRWEAARLENMLLRYDVTPEMLFYRFSELIPQHFGFKLHFLRFHHSDDSFRLIKHLNMNQLPVPSGIGLHEHYCRRWLSMRLIREMEQGRASGEIGDIPPPGAQISEFLETGEQFLSFGFARSMVLFAGVHSGVVVGFRLTPALRRTVRFLDDDAIPHVIIHETCERCPLSRAECKVRAAAPILLQANQAKAARQAALEELRREMVRG